MLAKHGKKKKEKRKKPEDPISVDVQMMKEIIEYERWERGHYDFDNVNVWFTWRVEDDDKSVLGSMGRSGEYSLILLGPYLYRYANI